MEKRNGSRSTVKQIKKILLNKKYEFNLKYFDQKYFKVQTLYTVLRDLAFSTKFF